MKLFLVYNTHLFTYLQHILLSIHPFSLYIHLSIQMAKYQF